MSGSKKEEERGQIIYIAKSRATRGLTHSEQSEVNNAEVDRQIVLVTVILVNPEHLCIVEAGLFNHSRGKPVNSIFTENKTGVEQCESNASERNDCSEYGGREISRRRSLEMITDIVYIKFLRKVATAP